MKKKDSAKKLHLNLQSIRNLTAGDLKKVAGGGPWTGSRCWCQ
ncbi:MAG TPA: class I lanthipeptide [Haliangiales bacterium]|nr:class I lanthipeptide [Haliangiales bacterium]